MKRVLISITVIVAATAGILAVTKPGSKHGNPSVPTIPISSAASNLPTIEELVTLSDDDLGKYDIALVNLVCAKGLPGTEDLDIGRYLAILDRWAELIAYDTGRHDYRFEKNPGEFENSFAYFRLLLMTSILQQDCGVRYNPDAIRDVDWGDPRDQFICGIIDGKGGTCVSLPVLYVAIGRRLGYPVNLVSAIGHLFARWDDPETGERINFEAHGNGLITRSDDYYKSWPVEMSARQIASGEYLGSKTPRGELACFLGCRGHVFLDHRKYYETEVAYFQAHDLFPEHETPRLFHQLYLDIREEQGFKPPPGYSR